jgi:hypothetical protein
MKRMTYIAVIVIALAGTGYSQRKNTDRDDFHDFVSALPHVNRVDLLKINFLQTDNIKNINCARTDLICGAHRFPLIIRESKTLSGEDAARFSVIWRKLKRGDIWRGCFSPDHVLRFYSDNNLLLETELCLICHQVKLPKGGVINIDGDMEAFDSLEDILMPDSARVTAFESFKRELMPVVNQQVTIIGILGVGKLGLLIPFREWDVYIYARKESDIAKLNALNRFSCHVVKVIGRLRYHPQQPPPPQSAIPVSLVPEHFYLDVGEAKVMSVYSPAPKRVKRTR